MVFHRGLAGNDALQHAVHPAGAFTARGALAAGFLVEELADAAGELDAADAVIEHHDGARTQARAQCTDGVVVHRQALQLGRGQHRHRHATRNRALQGAARTQATGHFQQVVEGGAQRHFEVAAVLHATGHREALRAAVGGQAQALEPLRAVADDRRHRTVGFGVVDRRRLAVQAEVRRERRLVARLALLAFQRFHQRGFFAADVGAVAVERVQLEAEIRTQQLVAQEAGGARLFQRFFEALVDFEDFAVDVVVADADAHGVGRDRHAFNHDVRIEAQDVAVLAGARLGFVRVAEDVLLHVALGHEGPLQGGREAGATAAAQARGLAHLDALLRRDLLFEDLAQGSVATGLQVAFVRPRGVVMQGGVDHLVRQRRGADRTLGFVVMCHALTPARPAARRPFPGSDAHGSDR
ncbi:hypothetical protein G6F22_013596 [Rhizopus arrhizus]|nr:hypothetical protein G6F22_013596 [Rhizopus arrhizus]